ncbi:MAG: pyridine nucleotide-disulfide oxidoreductase [Chloroflexi bacterium]|jgi:NADH dehydrogenase|nr:pyridine nucleotide-disulfide oxidoreductase [Chloroflexota bacterium]
MGDARPRVVIVGAGFGGLAAARALRGVPVDAVLVDQHNYHLFQPLLYQVATALLDPSEIAYPVRAALRRHRNVDFRLARVTGIDLERRRLATTGGELAYDHLVVSAGAVNNFFGLTSVEEHTHGLKSLGEALAVRNHLLSCFERAVWSDDPEARRRLHTVVLVGGGATGVELAGAVSELVHLVLRKDFPHLDLDEVRICVLEAGDTLLGAFAPSLQRAAIRTLERKRVSLVFGAQVAGVDERGVSLRDGRRIEAATVVWTAGVKGSPVGAWLGQVDRQGRIEVGPTLQLPGRPDVFVIGDLARVAGGRGEPLPQLAPVAMQEAKHVARTIAGSLRGEAPRPFHYRDRGTMATIGRNAGVAQIGPLRLGGFLGWVTWLTVHLMLLVGFRSRLVALLNWAWDYVVYDRPVRLIAAPAPSDPEDAER